MPSSSRLTIQASTIAQIQLMNDPVKQEKESDAKLYHGLLHIAGVEVVAAEGP